MLFRSWLPVVYMLDDQAGAADIIRTNGVIDVTATFGTPRADQAFGLAYSNFIGAPVSDALRPYITGRINDDQVESKRFEVFRLPAADNQSSVRFRLVQAGTASWYWGIDNWGLYIIPYTDMALGLLKNQATGSNTSVALSLSVNGRPLSAVANSSFVPPGPETGSVAFGAFPINLGSAGFTTLHAGQTNHLDFIGMDPGRIMRSFSTAIKERATVRPAIF